jgi:two-component system chemotaxis sensor kinase CheA
MAASVDASASAIEKIILEEIPNPRQAITIIGEIVATMQRVVRDGCNSEEMTWPQFVEVATEPAVAPTGQITHPNGLPSHIDESVFVEFLARQDSIMERAEEVILRAEKSGEEGPLSDLRRILHTLKGEAGMLGLVDVERLCHTIEDVLNEHPVAEISDLLLNARDWLARAFEFYSGRGAKPESVNGLLAALNTSLEHPENLDAESNAEAEFVEEEAEEPRPLEGDPGLLSEFIMEAREHLDAADVHLLTIETDPSNEEALNAVFRGFHTIKGVAGFLALDDILALAHEAENLLDKARKHEIQLTGSAIDVTFEAVDTLKQLISNVNDALTSGSGLISVPGWRTLVNDIKTIAAGKERIKKGAEFSKSAPGDRLGEILVENGATTKETLDRVLNEQNMGTAPKKIGEILVETGKVSIPVVNLAVEVAGANPGMKTGDVLVEMGAVTSTDIDDALKKQQNPTTPKIGELLLKSGEVSGKDIVQALRSQKAQTQPAVAQVREAVKVDADRLDLLVDMIGELVIAESMVSQSKELQSGRSTELARQINQLDKITRELQEMGMSLRMVPIRSTFQKMARLVRDLAKKSGKQVEFQTAGEDTELDKTVVDKIGDPLVHMIRNSVDHGLEPTTEERVKNGKPPLGRVELRAFHKGGSIYIEIEDDGRGLDREAILRKARERGLIREGETPPDRDTWNLIFEPGFSTAKQVTDVSGRGVGMDVVRRNIEALRGQIEIQTEAGRGTTISIRLPLTLAIIDGMVVRVGHERYIIPTLSIIMSIRPETQQISTVVGRDEMLMLQGRLLPLFRLGELFIVQDAIKVITEGIVIVVEDEGRQVGLLVDEILGQQQIVIKSLGEALQGIPGIAGGAIMPDGNVGLILDVGGLVRNVGPTMESGVA